MEKALDPAWTRVLGIEAIGAGQQDVPIDKVEGARIADMLVVARQEPDGLGRQLDFIDIAERLFDEENSLAVMRKVSPLAKKGQPSNVRGQFLVGRFRGLVRRRRRRRSRGREAQWQAGLCGWSRSAPVSAVSDRIRFPREKRFTPATHQCSPGELTPPTLGRRLPGTVMFPATELHAAGSRNLRSLLLVTNSSARAKLFRGRCPSAEAPQQIATRGMQQMILIEIAGCGERIDERDAG